MAHRFTPNDFAREKFNLSAACYDGTEGLVELFTRVLGEAAYNRHMIAGNPLHGGRTEADIRIDANDIHAPIEQACYRSIGILKVI
jgi:hypothetical protein